jgi:hypothetical protein
MILIEIFIKIHKDTKAIKKKSTEDISKHVFLCFYFHYGSLIVKKFELKRELNRRPNCKNFKNNYQEIHKQ